MIRLWRLWRLGFRFKRVGWPGVHLVMWRGTEQLCLLCDKGVLFPQTWEHIKPGTLTDADREHIAAVTYDTQRARGEVTVEDIYRRPHDEWGLLPDGWWEA